MNMNVRLLRKIAKVIQERPLEFNMSCFTKTTPCGASHCIGGWAAVLSGKKEQDTSEEEMSALLGVTPEQGSRLFYPSEDNGFGGMLATPKQAAARIEHFIKTKGAE